jgi:hypothetical protein
MAGIPDTNQRLGLLCKFNYKFLSRVDDCIWLKRDFTLFAGLGIDTRRGAQVILESVAAGFQTQEKYFQTCEKAKKCIFFHRD